MVDLEPVPTDSTRSQVEAALTHMVRAERALQGFREALLEDLRQATDAERLGCLTVLGELEARFVEAVRAARNAVTLSHSSDLSADQLLASVQEPERVVTAELDALWSISMGAAAVFEILFERASTRADARPYPTEAAPP
jgi:hypothetical protein